MSSESRRIGASAWRCMPLRPGTVAGGVIWLALFLAVPAPAAQLRDQTGRLVTLPDRAQRIVTLAPNLTELVFALGAGRVVVGCCRHSNFPAETQNLPRVGSYYLPDMERIVILRPDLCIAVWDGTPRIVLKRLEQLGIPVLILNPQSLEKLREAVLLLGAVLNCRERAESLIADMDERIAQVDALAADLIRLRGDRPTVLVRVQAGPFMAAARGTFPAELVERAGGWIPLRGDVPYPRLSAEELLALAPDVIITTRGGDMQPEDLYGRTSTVPIYSVPEDLFFRPSLRSLEVLDMLVALLWRQDVPVTPPRQGAD